MNNLSSLRYEVATKNFIDKRDMTPVEDEVKRIRGRFDDIVSILEARGINLEATLNDAEQYQTLHIELLAWLDSAEEVQQKWKPVGNDLITIRRQYLEHQVSMSSIGSFKTLHLLLHFLYTKVHSYLNETII